MEENKIIIIMPYYERPKMVLNALKSVSEMNYKNYIFAIIDDGSKMFPMRQILLDHNEYNKNIILYETNHSIEDKLKFGGSKHGLFMNKAIEENESDICIMFSDDDAITKDYCKNLNEFYKKNLHIKYSYSHVIPFDPLSEMYDERTERNYQTSAATNLNKIHEINPCCQIDSTQVSWRRECNMEDGIWFNGNITKNLDADFYDKMFNRYGYCSFNGMIGCYKGFHKEQLGGRVGEEQFRTHEMK